MPYGSETYECKGMATYDSVPQEPPRPTLHNNIDAAMNLLKELLIAMADAHIAMYGEPAVEPNEKLPEPDSMYATTRIIAMQARIALERFLSIRKKIY